MRSEEGGIRKKTAYQTQCMVNVGCIQSKWQNLEITSVSEVVASTLLFCSEQCNSLSGSILATQ